MTYATMMVLMELGCPNTSVLQVAGDLAERFHASVIGIAVSQPMQVVYGDGCFIPGDLIERDEAAVAVRMQKAELEFRGALQARVQNVEWRSGVTLGPLAGYIACEARSADLVITGSVGAASLNTCWRANIGDLVMQTGRPVLVVPASADRLKLDRVIIGWKETPETRRAVCDALPLLKQASDIVVAEVAVEDEMAASRARIEDVVNWLSRHDIRARSIASSSNSDDATCLNRIAQQQEAGLIVAGAYGHARLQEWILGGVTRDLLLRAEQRCSLLSH